MSLQWYRRPRLVVLKPNAPVFEAGRAIEHNNIGAVMVQDRGGLLGILTDRDLAIRVVGQGRDPKTTLVGDVMTAPVLTLTPKDSQSDAIQLMQERNIRRIPLVEGERLVGMVTLDDLLLDEAAPLEELAAIVEAQVGEGGPADPASAPGMRRRLARSESTYRRLLNEVRTNAGLQSADEAEQALEAVLSGVVCRLTSDEALHLIAQLPSRIQPTLRRLPPGPDRSVDRRTIEAELSRRLGVDQARAAEILTAVGATIAERVSDGQMKDVQRQLPEEMRSIFPAVAA